jgi:ribosomal-protein-alanine N-acetyltransferase
VRTISTARLTLREPAMTDVELLRDYHRRNGERLARFDAVPPDDEAVHREWIGMHHRWRREGLPVAFIAFDGTTATLAGFVALSGFAGEDEGTSAMINYSIDGAYEGKGYALEMTAAALEYGFATLGLASVSAHVLVGNERSLRLLDRLGFTVIARSPTVPGFEHLMRPHVLAMVDRVRFAAAQQ